MKTLAPIFFAISLLGAGCGGQIDGDAAGDIEAGDENAPQVEGGTATLDTPPGQGIVQIESLLAWWHSKWTWDHWTSLGWDDTDLAVSAGTAIQLRHASRLVAHGTYAWGYMPTFVDTVTGHKFKFLHLKPQYERATQNGHVYPAGYVVGYSGGNTWDTGGAGRGYSTGAHLCVQTLVGFRKAFPW